jgi:predicted Zn-dependent protease
MMILLVGCASTGVPRPDQGLENITLETDFDDAKMGAEAARVVSEELGLIEDPELQEYIEAIARRMLPYAPQRPFDYSFHIVDQAAPNAFALPGGHIYVSRGLLTLVNSEDELACVVGHEITHAAERHHAGRQQFGQRLNPFSIGFMRALQLAAYGREQERDADHGGQLLAAKAGWNPAALADFMRDVDAMDRLAEGWSRLPGFFDSHPTSPERSATAANRAQHLRWQPRAPIVPGKFAFLERMEGLPLGDNPREGIFEGTRFMHLDMDFSLRFPDGWHLQNTHQAVGAIEPTRSASIALQIEGPGDDPEAMAHFFIARELAQARGRVLQRQAIRVGDYPGYRLTVQTPFISGSMTFIAYEGLIYRIAAIAAKGALGRFEGRTRATVRSFRPLQEEEKELFKISRLRVVRAKMGENLAALGNRTENSLDLGTTAVLNDIFIDARLKEGQLIKIGRSEPYEPSEEGEDFRTGD